MKKSPFGLPILCWLNMAPERFLPTLMTKEILIWQKNTVFLLELHLNQKMGATLIKLKDWKYVLKGKGYSLIQASLAGFSPRRQGQKLFSSSRTKKPPKKQT